MRFVKLPELPPALMSAQRISARGALHTIMETLLEELSFNAPERPEKRFPIDVDFVRERLAKIADDEDLSRYIL